MNEFNTFSFQEFQLSLSKFTEKNIDHWDDDTFRRD